MYAKGQQSSERGIEQGRQPHPSPFIQLGPSRVDGLLVDSLAAKGFDDLSFREEPAVESVGGPRRQFTQLREAEKGEDGLTYC